MGIAAHGVAVVDLRRKAQRLQRQEIAQRGPGDLVNSVQAVTDGRRIKQALSERPIDLRASLQAAKACCSLRRFTRVGMKFAKRTLRFAGGGSFDWIRSCRTGAVHIPAKNGPTPHYLPCRVRL